MMEVATMVSLHRESDRSGSVPESVTPVKSRRSRRLRELGLMLAFVVVAGGTLAIVSSVAPHRSGAASGDAVPDTMLLKSWGQGYFDSSLRAYAPATGAIVPVVDGMAVGDVPRVSADGQRLAVLQSTTTGNQLATSVLVLKSDTLETLWSRPVSTSDATMRNDEPAVFNDIAIAGDRVYAATHPAQSHDPVTIVAWDLASGDEVGRWDIDAGLSLSDVVGLRTTPDGSRLTLLVNYTAPSPNGIVNVGAVQFGLPAMNELWRDIPGASSQGVGIWPGDGKVTPDGATLYSVGYGNSSTRLEVRFFDLEHGEPLMSVELGRTAGADWFFQHATSPDGKRLYLFTMNPASIAIVNLETHRLESTADLDTSVVTAGGPSLLGRIWQHLQGLVVTDAAAKTWFSGSMQFSPDGSRLYAAGLENDGSMSEPRGVWVIDTTTWQVTDAWATDFSPTQVWLGGGGRNLYLLRANWDASGGHGEIAVIDTVDGTQSTAIDAGDTSQAWSLYDLYRENYGVTPQSFISASGSSGADPDAGIPYAKLVVSTSATTTIVGRPVAISAAFVNPADNQPLSEGDTSVRFAQPDAVVATLSIGAGGDAEQVTLAPDGYGAYRGDVVLPSAGAWDVEVVATRDGEASRRVAKSAAITVQPAQRGSDGHDYLVKVTIDPAQPAPNASFALTAEFVDADSGAPLPSDVQLNGGMPDLMDASFYLGTDGGMTSAVLRPADRGRYTGTASVFDPGTWLVQIKFRNDGAAPVIVNPGTVLVQ
jgi:hypothetical protein